MGAKKAVNLFKIYCLSAAVMGGGIKLSAVFQMEFICNRFLSAFQFLFCILLFIAALFGFVALAYYLGGKKILKCDLVEALRTDYMG